MSITHVKAKFVVFQNYYADDKVYTVIIQANPIKMSLKIWTA
jgi:hypothetical protein